MLNNQPGSNDLIDLTWLDVEGEHLDVTNANNNANNNSINVMLVGSNNNNANNNDINNAIPVSSNNNNANSLESLNLDPMAQSLASSIRQLLLSPISTQPVSDATAAAARKWHDLGNDYITGNGMPKNITEALRCFLKAVECAPGWATPWIDIGNCLMSGTGTYADPNGAFRCYQRANKMCNQYTQPWLNLAYCYQNGKGTNPNQLVAFRCYLSAVATDKNRIAAWRGLEYCFRNGKGVMPEIQLADICATNIRNIKNKREVISLPKLNLVLAPNVASNNHNNGAPAAVVANNNNNNASPVGVIANNANSSNHSTQLSQLPTLSQLNINNAKPVSPSVRLSNDNDDDDDVLLVVKPPVVFSNNNPRASSVNDEIRQNQTLVLENIVLKQELKDLTSRLELTVDKIENTNQLIQVKQKELTIASQELEEIKKQKLGK